MQKTFNRYYLLITVVYVNGTTSSVTSESVTSRKEVETGKAKVLELICSSSTERLVVCDTIIFLDKVTQITVEIEETDNV